MKEKSHTKKGLSFRVQYIYIYIYRDLIHSDACIVCMLYGHKTE